VNSAADGGSHARPMLTVDVVALTAGAHPRVLLVERGHPPFVGSWALPGGFVEAGERISEAAPRELAEETGLQVDGLELFGVYDTPGRDPRGSTVSIVYRVRLASERSVSGADDASDARWFALDELPELAFDHATIVADATGRAGAG
jgi:8-oxo-dGTP diphosphatase